MKLACSHIKKKNTDIFTTWVNQVLTSTSASRPSSTEGPAPGAISIPVSIPVSVTVSDTVFAPAPASATTTTVTAAAASSAIVAFTVRVPSRRVAIIIPLPGAIVSLTVISSPENFFFFLKTMSEMSERKTHVDMVFVLFFLNENRQMHTPAVSAVARTWLWGAVIHASQKFLVSFVFTICLNKKKKVPI